MKEASIDMATSSPALYRPTEPHGTFSSCMRRLAPSRGKVHRLDRIIRNTVALPRLARRPEQQVWSNAYQKAGDIAKLGSFAEEITCEKTRTVENVMREESGLS